MNSGGISAGGGSALRMRRSSAWRSEKVIVHEPSGSRKRKQSRSSSSGTLKPMASSAEENCTAEIWPSPRSPASPAALRKAISRLSSTRECARRTRRCGESSSTPRLCSGSGGAELLLLLASMRGRDEDDSRAVATPPLALGCRDDGRDAGAGA